MTKYFVDSNGVYSVASMVKKSSCRNLASRCQKRRAISAESGKTANESRACRRLVLKPVVQARTIDVGKMQQACGMQTGNPVYFARWFAPDRPEVYCHDLDAVGLARPLGLDSAAISAP